MLRTSTIVGLGLALLAIGCHGGSGGPGGGGGGGDQRLNGGGSSFVYPMMSKWASEYLKGHGVKVNYQSIGSGGGIQQMTQKILDFGCTDSPMNEEQLKKAQETGGDVVHVPLVMGAIVIAYHLDEVKEPLKFTGPVLADIYLGKIKKWNDQALREINPGAALPDREISVVHRSDGSGSTFILVDYFSKVSAEWKSRVGVGTSVNWPVGLGQKGTEGVAGQVKRSPGSIGYVELTYALQNNIPYGAIKNREGTWVTPSLESVSAAASAALAQIPEDLRYSLTDAPGKDAYPISGTTWAVLYTRQPAGKGQLVLDFLRWMTHDGQEYTRQMHYASLPPGLVQRVDQKLAQVQVGQ